MAENPYIDLLFYAFFILMFYSIVRPTNVMAL